MKRVYIIFAITILFSGILQAVEISGTLQPVIKVTPSRTTGLDAIYVADDVPASGRAVSLSYTSHNGRTDVKWYRYNALGGGYAEELQPIREGVRSTIERAEGDMGYIIEDGTDREYFWLVNYAAHQLRIDAINVSNGDCQNVRLDVQGAGESIVYYSITGDKKILERGLKLTYNTLEWDAQAMMFNQREAVEDYDDFSNVIMPVAPLCNTTFTLSGDRFLNEWGKGIRCESDLFNATAIEVYATATQQDAPEETSTLGGSAPVTIDFKGYYSDAVSFHEWVIARDPKFEDIEYRFNEADLTHVFNEAGTFYVRMMASDAEANCTAYSDVFMVAIGESLLEIPNAFSPYNEDGNNDLWKVKAQSLVEFECHIFNKQGIEIYSFKDINGSWDGKYKGKFVNPGVYYYVIIAKGADGKKYRRGGDINLVRSRRDPSRPSPDNSAY